MRYLHQKFLFKETDNKECSSKHVSVRPSYLYVGCQALLVFMLCNDANLICINPGLVKTCYSRRPYAMCCVNQGKSSLFGNRGHKLGDGILSQGLFLVPTLCRLGELYQQS